MNERKRVFVSAAIGTSLALIVAVLCTIFSAPYISEAFGQQKDDQKEEATTVIDAGMRDDTLHIGVKGPIKGFIATDCRADLKRSHRYPKSIDFVTAKGDMFLNWIGPEQHLHVEGITIHFTRIGERKFKDTYSDMIFEPIEGHPPTQKEVDLQGSLEWKWNEALLFREKGLKRVWKHVGPKLR